MKSYQFYALLLLSVLFNFKSASAQSTKTQWAKAITGTNLYSYSNGNAIAVDKNGNVLTAGTFFDTCDLDPGSGVYNLIEYESRPDIFIQKLDATGNFIWAKRIGGEYDQNVNAIATDSLGNVYITGYFEDTIDFDPGAGVFNLMTTAANTFILKLNAAGQFVWAKSFYGTAFDAGQALVLDKDANIYVTGAFMGTTDFDPNAGVQTFTASGISGLADVFVVKLNTNGSLIWARQLGGPDDDRGYGIALDNSGNVLLTGEFASTVDFDPGSGTQNLTAVSRADVFILKLDGSGNLVWAKSVGGTWADVPNSLALDKSNNIFIGGDFGISSFVTNATCDFDPGPGVFNLTTNSSTDMFLLKLKPNGDFDWAKKLVGTPNNDDKMYEVTVDDSGYLYATGFFSYTMDFDPSAGEYMLKATDRYITNRVGDYDVFIAKYSNVGNLVWAQNYGGEMHDLAGSITVDKKGTIYATGAYEDTAYFYPEDSTKMLLSGFQGSYVLKIGADITNTNRLAETNFMRNIKVYPNPNNGAFRIDIKGKGTLAIINAQGALVNDIHVNENTSTIQIDALSNGIYFLTGTIDGIAIHEKIVVAVD